MLRKILMWIVSHNFRTFYVFTCARVPTFPNGLNDAIQHTTAFILYVHLRCDKIVFDRENLNEKLTRGIKLSTNAKTLFIVSHFRVMTTTIAHARRINKKFICVYDWMVYTVYRILTYKNGISQYSVRTPMVINCCCCHNVFLWSFSLKCFREERRTNEKLEWMNFGNSFVTIYLLFGIVHSICYSFVPHLI